MTSQIMEWSTKWRTKMKKMKEGIPREETTIKKVKKVMMKMSRKMMR